MQKQYATSTEYDDGEYHYPSSMAHIGQEAPTFSTKGVIDGEIVNVKLKDYRGKWVI